jgi:hypothetical protein
MSEFYFDVGAWEKDVEARDRAEKEEQEAGTGGKRKRPSKKDLVGFSSLFSPALSVPPWGCSTFLHRLISSLRFIWCPVLSRAHFLLIDLNNLIGGLRSSHIFD